MGAISYEIIPYGEGWTVLRNDERGADYATAEAALEAVAAQASIELGNNEILIRVRPAPA